MANVIQKSASRSQRKSTSYVSNKPPTYRDYVPCIMGLLERGDKVCDIAAHFEVDPAFIGGLASGGFGMSGVTAQDMSHYPALECARNANVEVALERLDDVVRALQNGDLDAAVGQLLQLRDVLISYSEYWKR